jgi:hypothetical protein
MPPWSDLAVLLGILCSTGWWVTRLRRGSIRGGGFAAAAAVGFLGIVLVVTMTAHCLDIVSRLAVGTGHDGAAFVYGFRTYSLLLLGALLIASGIRLLRLSSSLGTGASSRGPALRAVLVVLALVAPLIPIHGFFAIPLSVIAGLALSLVLWPIGPAGRPAEPVVGGAATSG